MEFNILWTLTMEFFFFFDRDDNQFNLFHPKTFIIWLHCKQYVRTSYFMFVLFDLYQKRNQHYVFTVKMVPFDPSDFLNTLHHTVPALCSSLWAHLWIHRKIQYYDCFIWIVFFHHHNFIIFPWIRWFVCK